MEQLKEWQVVELLKTTTDFFTSKNVDEPRISAELLLAHVLGKSRLDLYLHYNRPVYQDELERFRVLCRERLEGRPVQYILGEQYFYGLRFQVDERVLIPRPETELLVEHALELLGFSNRGGDGEVKVLDIGTGSGCIALTMAKLCLNLQVTAVDCSPRALEVALLNAEKLGVESRVSFILADMQSEAFVGALQGAAYDLVISNPPYIPRSEWEGLQREVRQFEPEVALTTPSGMECYQALAALGPKLLLPGGKLSLELHSDAAQEVSALMAAEGFSSITVLKDYSQHDRVISGQHS